MEAGGSRANRFVNHFPLNVGMRASVNLWCDGATVPRAQLLTCCAAPTPDSGACIQAREPNSLGGHHGFAASTE